MVTVDDDSMVPRTDNPIASRLAASVILFRGSNVLLVRRGKDGPGADRWSAPGGHVEAGETAIEAARRELEEETGLTALQLREHGVHRVPAQNDKTPLGSGRSGYEISVFTGEAASADAPVAGGDAVAVRYVPITSVTMLTLTDGLADIIAAASRRRQTATDGS